MKVSIIIALLGLSSSVFAATNSNSNTVTVINTSNTFTGPAKAFFSTNVVGLLSGRTNVGVNFFILPQAALSVSWINENDKTTPLKKAAFDPGTKLTVTSTRLGLGGAYYFFPMEQKWNTSVNPFIISERKSDVQETETNTGVGIKADAMYFINSLALTGGLQASSVAGDNDLEAIAGIGYLF